MAFDPWISLLAHLVVIEAGALPGNELLAGDVDMAGDFDLGGFDLI